LSFEGNREAGLAALFLSVLQEGKIKQLTLKNTPVSYLFDNREKIDYFSMAIHLPGFLTWGDVSLAAGLSGQNVTFLDPVTMSGAAVSSGDLNAFRGEFEKAKRLLNQPGNIYFQHSGK
jgi:hypothetical protein